MTDRGGKRGSATLSVQAGTAPTVSIEAPAGYRDGEPVALHASATDDEAVPDGGFAWQLLLRHNTHFHPFTGQTGRDITFTPPTDHDADAYVDVRLTVTDADGLVTRTTLQLQPQTAPVKLISEPAGAPMEYAGRSVTGPFETEAAIGFEGSVSAARSFTREGHEYAFDGWDAGGPRSRPLTVPEGGITLTAGYRDTTPALVAPAPAPVLPPPDRLGPRLRFSRTKGLDARQGVLNGTTSDAAGVKLVEVALGRGTSPGAAAGGPHPRGASASGRAPAHALAGSGRSSWARAGPRSSTGSTFRPGATSSSSARWTRSGTSAAASVTAPACSV